MHRRQFLTLALLLPGLGGRALAQGSDPGEPIRRLYDAYGIGDTTDLGRLDRLDTASLYSRSLLALYRRAVNVGLESDFFVQGQDFSLAKPIEIGAVTTTGGKATVAARLTSNDIDPKTRQKRVDDFVFSMVQEGGRWRIDDAAHGRDTLRRAWTKMAAAGPRR